MPYASLGQALKPRYDVGKASLGVDPNSIFAGAKGRYTGADQWAGPDTWEGGNNFLNLYDNKGSQIDRAEIEKALGLQGVRPGDERMSGGQGASNEKAVTEFIKSRSSDIDKKRLAGYNSQVMEYDKQKHEGRLGNFAKQFATMVATIGMPALAPALGAATGISAAQAGAGIGAATGGLNGGIKGAVQGGITGYAGAGGAGGLGEAVGAAPGQAANAVGAGIAGAGGSLAAGGNLSDAFKSGAQAAGTSLVTDQIGGMVSDSGVDDAAMYGPDAVQRASLDTVAAPPKSGNSLFGGIISAAGTVAANNVVNDSAASSYVDSIIPDGPQLGYLDNSNPDTLGAAYAGLDPLQRRTKIATDAMYGGGGIDTPQSDFIMNDTNNRLLQEGVYDLTPVEEQYFRQQGYDFNQGDPESLATAFARRRGAKA